MKILAKICGDKLLIINRKKLNSEYRNMLNTNVISNDELVFSDAYILENEKIIVTFLNDLIKTYNLSSISFQNNEVARIFIRILPKLKNINSIYIESSEMLTYKFSEILIKCPDLKYVSAEYIPSYIFELLDKMNIVPESRNEILFSSKFMSQNSLNNYSSLFYKNSIYIEYPILEQDLTDLKTFLNINRHLRVIHIVNLSKFNLLELLNILKETNHKNIKIIIYGDILEKELIDYLKKYAKAIKKKRKISFKIKYSDKFIKENIVSETNNNILRMIAILIIFIILGIIITTSYQSFMSVKHVKEVQNDIKNHIEKTDNNTIEEKITEIKNNNIENELNINRLIVALKLKNNDAVGWLKINNTNIDYPIVQAKDNDYYLSHNFNKKEEDSGWLFLDYENNPKELDDNNIIYGHNYYHNGVMFGTLNNVLKKNWIKNPDNLIISYETLYHSYKFKIFSVYIIPTTDDYIHPYYGKYEEKTEFFKKIIKRSIYDFDVNLTDEDKILTLQTCQNETSRLVVHAVLIN